MPSWIKDHFSARAFMQGLAVVAVTYLLLFLYTYMQTGKTIAQLESKLAAQAVVITRDTHQAPGGTALRPEDHARAPDDPQQPAHTNPRHEAPAHEAPDEAPDSLPPAPFSGLTEHVKEGEIPVVSDAGQTPFEAYRRPFRFANKPVIAFVVRDYGLSASDSALMLSKLPADVSFILSPYSDSPAVWAQKARGNGHEFWMHVPAQNSLATRSDPGPQALLGHASLQYNQDRLKWAMARAPGYAGIALESDDAFLSTAATVRAIFQSVFKRGLGYMEMNPDAPTMVETIAVAENAPYARANMSAISDRDSLAELQKRARAKGYAVAILQPYPALAEDLENWVAELEQSGFMLAPLSAIAEISIAK